MMDLHHQILPPSFVTESPKEAGFCFWLLLPDPSSRPTTREILQSELSHGSEDTCLNNDAVSCADNAELDILHHFLVSAMELKEDKASKLLETKRLLETDNETVKRAQSSLKSSADGVSKKIKIYEFGSLLDDSVDVEYPVLEMSNSSKLSCVCRTSYIRNYLASTDYDGLVQTWDASTAQAFP